MQATVEIERVDLDLAVADAEADAADASRRPIRISAHAGLVEMLAEDAARALGRVAEDALEMLAHHVDAERQQRFEIGLASPGRSARPQSRRRDPGDARLGDGEPVPGVEFHRAVEAAGVEEQRLVGEQVLLDHDRRARD